MQRATKRPHDDVSGPVDQSNLPYYASAHTSVKIGDTIPESGMPAQHVLAKIEDQHSLDFKEKLNTSSYVNVVFEPEERVVAQLGLSVNIADQTVYSSSWELHNKVVNMVAELWHCPKPADFDRFGCFPGAGTVGSTEACLLAALALKFRWRKWYGAKTGKTKAQVRSVAPNMVISTLYQAAWEKLFLYMDVDPKFVTPTMNGVGRWELHPEHVATAIDDQTIGVVCILGNHYSGHYDNVADVAAAVRKANSSKKTQVGIHVDGASGGFVAPFQPEVKAWDFRVPEVLSISASGHKFGQSCCGTGWVVWRQRKDLSEHVAVSVAYLGGAAESYTLNFSRPASGIYVQFYKFLRLGMQGYTQVVRNMMTMSSSIRAGLKGMTRPGQDGSPAMPWFTILDNGDSNCLPVVAAMLNPALKLPFDSCDLQHALSVEHWYVCGYALNFTDPLTDADKPLFSDCSPDQTSFRVVVKANLTMPLAENLLRAFVSALDFLVNHGEGFKKHHPKQAFVPGHKAC